MSVAWFTALYRLNEAGRFAEALARSDAYLGQRPRDYALHLQRARALVGLGQLDEAAVHLDAAVTHSQGLAAWPYFYRATLHALAGRRARAKADLARAVTLDPSLAEVAARHEALAPLRVKAPRPATTLSRVRSPAAAVRAPGRRAPTSPRPLEASGRTKPARVTAPAAAARAPARRAPTSPRRSAPATATARRATGGAAAPARRGSGSPRRTR